MINIKTPRVWFSYICLFTFFVQDLFASVLWTL